MTNQIKLPQGRVMLDFNRIQGYIQSINALITKDGVQLQHFDTNNSTRNRFDSIKKWLSKREVEFQFRPKFKVGQEVLYFDNNPYTNKVLQKGVIDGIEINTYEGSINTYFYYINGRSYLTYNLYSNKDEYMQRTKPKKELKDNERYIMTRYMTQQNYLIPVKVERKTDVVSILKSNYSYGEEVRSSFLYTNENKFFNRMFGNLN